MLPQDIQVARVHVQDYVLDVLALVKEVVPVVLDVQEVAPEDVQEVVLVDVLPLVLANVKIHAIIIVEDVKHLMLLKVAVQVDIVLLVEISQML